MVLGITDSQRDGLSFVEGLDVSKAEKGKKLTVQDSSVFEYIVRIQEILGRSGVSPDRIVCDGENLEKLEGQSGTLHLEHYGELTETIRFEKSETTEESNT